jgi:hypothetical protein
VKFEKAPEMLRRAFEREFENKTGRAATYRDRSMMPLDVRFGFLCVGAGTGHLL